MAQPRIPRFLRLALYLVAFGVVWLGSLVLLEWKAGGGEWGEYWGVDEEAWLGFWGTFVSISAAALLGVTQLRHARTQSDNNERTSMERERKWREVEAFEQLRESVEEFFVSVEEEEVDSSRAQRKVLFKIAKWRLVSGLTWRETMEVENELYDALTDIASKNPRLQEPMGRGDLYGIRLREEVWVVLSQIEEGILQNSGDRVAALKQAADRLRTVRGHFGQWPPHTYNPIPWVDN